MSRLDDVMKRVDQSGDCWLFLGMKDRGGYGKVRIGGRSGRTVGVHRWVYEQLVGPVPEGLHLDHLCRVRHCVNPAHLESVTPHENWRRGRAPSRINAEKTTCGAGHPLDIENGGRRCSICRRVEHTAYMRTYREAKR